MELSTIQYNYIIEAVKRYRTTLRAKCKVYNSEDQNRIMKLNHELGLDVKLPRCMSCNGMIYAVALFSEVNQLVEKYESQNKNN
jgi:uncharacterized protein with PIN domain